MSITGNREITHLDLRGMTYPTPVVTTSKAVNQLHGRPAVLCILSDDEGFANDLESWCRATRSELVSLERADDGVFSATIRVNTRSNGARNGDGDGDGNGSPGNGKRADLAPGRRSDESDLDGDAATLRGSPGRHAPRVFDFRGQRCPEPIIQLAKEVRHLDDAQEIEVLADDDSFPMDVKSWCRSAGATLLSIDHDGSTYRAMIAPRAKTKMPARATRSGNAQESSFTPAPTHAGPPPVTPAIPAVPVAARTPTGPIAVPAAAISMAAEVDASPVQFYTLPPSTTARPDCVRVDLSSMPRAAFAPFLDSLDHFQMPGTVVAIMGRHDTFAQDVATYCARRGHSLLRLNTDTQPMIAEIALTHEARDDSASTGKKDALVAMSAGLPAELALTQKNCVLLILHNDLETLLAAFMTANAAAAGGMNVTMFFAFWGVNVLRGDRPRADTPRQKVSFMQRMFKAMMPRGPRRQRLSKLSFGGMGGKIMVGIMHKKNILDVEELMERAIDGGVKFIACTTSMEVMGITRRDLVDLPNLEFAGVTSFVDMARGAGFSTMF